MARQERRGIAGMVCVITLSRREASELIARLVSQLADEPVAGSAEVCIEDSNGETAERLLFVVDSRRCA